ncbi:PREDICTED: uncharacterized protein KIAA1211-like homolog [Mandrillus leucophaeus]|uniref:uncharacterized protein KIAA1211-like homolog n=1 Tax=Mandrillus leucophaeus TaxID=9568 RepID=UPI0005F3932A|nr:PREDICTED: uncharacterized protein KIAA1211-like homolog [Mandrillus leucophaeus]
MRELEAHSTLRRMAAFYQCIRPDPSELDMISTRVMDIKLRETAEGLGEDSTGKKKSKFKTFKKFFGKKKRKESPSSTESSTWKQSQTRNEVIAIESGPVGYDSEDELEESRGTLGSRALSHDSIFIPESGQDPTRPVRVFSQENVCDRIKALQLKIQCNVKMGPPPPPGGLPAKRGEDAGMSSEDDGLPRSPPEMSLLHDVGPGTTIKVSVVSPDHVSDSTVSARTSDSSLAPVADFSYPPESSSCLDNSAAKHKLQVKPRNQRSSKMRRLSSRAQSESLSDLTCTPEEEENEEKPLLEVSPEESPSSGQQDVPPDRGPEPGPPAPLPPLGGVRPPLPRKPLLQSFTLPHQAAPPDTGPGERDPRKEPRTAEKRSLRRGAGKSASRVREGPGLGKSTSAGTSCWTLANCKEFPPAVHNQVRVAQLHMERVPCIGITSLYKIYYRRRNPIMKLYACVSTDSSDRSTTAVAMDLEGRQNRGLRLYLLKHRGTVTVLASAGCQKARKLGIYTVLQLVASGETVSFDSPQLPDLTATSLVSYRLSNNAKCASENFVVLSYRVFRVVCEGRSPAASALQQTKLATLPPRAAALHGESGSSTIRKGAHTDTDPELLVPGLWSMVLCRSQSSCTASVGAKHRRRAYSSERPARPLPQSRVAHHTAALPVLTGDKGAASLSLSTVEEKGLPPAATGPGADGQPVPPWITVTRQKRRGTLDQPPNQEDKPGTRTLKSEPGKQAKVPERAPVCLVSQQEPVKQADFVRSKSFLITPVKPAVDRKQGAKLNLKEGLQRGISLSHQNLAQSAVMMEKELHQLKRASYASTDQPSWMELARKKSQAWSDMPQIIK